MQVSPDRGGVSARQIHGDILGQVARKPLGDPVRSDASLPSAQFALNLMHIHLPPHKGVHLSAAKGHFAIVNTISRWVTIVLAFVSTIIVALRCDLAHPWIFIGATCSNLVRLPAISACFPFTDYPLKFTRWQVVTAFDIITEVAIFSVIVFLIRGLQLSLFNKFTVILAFGFRLL